MGKDGEKPGELMHFEDALWRKFFPLYFTGQRTVSKVATEFFYTEETIL